MRDCLGNKLEPGQYVFWHQKGLFCKVTKVEEPTLMARESLPPRVALEVILDARKPSPGQELMIVELVRVVSPEQEDLLDKLMGSTRPQ